MLISSDITQSVAPDVPKCLYFDGCVFSKGQLFYNKIAQSS